MTGTTHFYPVAIRSARVICAQALSEFDRAVLATVLTKGRSLRDSGETDVSFCVLDSDLWPWGKSGRGAELKKLYDYAGVRVYPDFTLTSPERPEGFGQTTRK